MSNPVTDAEIEEWLALRAAIKEPIDVWLDDPKSLNATYIHVAATVLPRVLRQLQGAREALVAARRAYCPRSAEEVYCPGHFPDRGSWCLLCRATTPEKP